MTLEQYTSPPIFILVHGTFARGAPWTGDDSLLVQSLRRKYAEAKVVQFLWSGRNAHSERTAAAVDLARLMEAETSEQPAHPIVLISHSHGGNICIYATGHTNARIAGIVCMATPFIDVSARTLPHAAPHGRWSLAIGRSGA